PHDDWLRLDQRRVNNPVEHLSNNQVIGFIDISRDGNPDLMDQTNREGLMNNRALEDLRRLVYFVLQILEADRQSIRHPVRRVSSVNGSTSDGSGAIAQELERLAGQAGPELARELRQVGRRFEEEHAREQAMQARLIEGYSGLAAVGQVAAGLLTLLPQELGRMEEELRAIRRALAGTNGNGRTLQALAGSPSFLAVRLQLLQ